MKANDIMSCSFAICSIGDTIDMAIKRIQEKKKSFIVVIDNFNCYRGIVTTCSLLGHVNFPNQKIDDLIQTVHPVLENEDITNLNGASTDTIPVIDGSNMVVGVIDFRSLAEYTSLNILKYKSNSPSNYKNDYKHSPRYSLDDIIGESKAILLLKERIVAASKTKSTVLLMGETGTGKELIAHAIAKLSNRRHQPFIKLNCAAIPESLLESELFGYEQGAFTGAMRGGKPGKFIIANNGTIFLDEIGDMPLTLQAKILRVLQEREVEKIGGHSPIPIDVRVIAATNGNLLELVKENKFRKDLFYRLHVIPINIPPLRIRKEDIPLLVDYFITKISKEFHINKPSIESLVMEKLMEYHWPGNVRELLNITEMAVSLCNDVITNEHIPEYLFNEIACPRDDFYNMNNLKGFTGEVEREAIIKALKKCRGNKIKVAETLGISRSNLYYKMKKFDIDA